MGRGGDGWEEWVGGGGGVGGGGEGEEAEEANACGDAAKEVRKAKQEAVAALADATLELVVECSAANQRCQLGHASSSLGWWGGPSRPVPRAGRRHAPEGGRWHLARVRRAGAGRGRGGCENREGKDGESGGLRGGNPTPP